MLALVQGGCQWKQNREIDLLTIQLKASQQSAAHFETSLRKESATVSQLNAQARHLEQLLLEKAQDQRAIEEKGKAFRHNVKQEAGKNETFATWLDSDLPDATVCLLITRTGGTCHSPPSDQ